MAISVLHNCAQDIQGEETSHFDGVLGNIVWQLGMWYSLSVVLYAAFSLQTQAHFTKVVLANAHPVVGNKYSCVQFQSVWVPCLN